MACQIEISVVGKVRDGIFIASHVIVNADLIIVGQGVADTNVGIARVILVTIRAEQGKGNLCAILCFADLRIPDPVTKEIRSAVKIVDTIVIDDERIGNAVNGAGGSADTVCVPSHNLAKMRILMQICFRFLISQNDICQRAVFVRNPHFQPDTAKIRKSSF